ncbi:MAG: DNA topoisomerase 3 [Acidobacteriota bacterium]
MSVVVVAEKPSVARDIAQVVGARERGDGYLHGGGCVVTWAVGHLVMLAEPHQIEAAWKLWRRESLPMLPRSWPLVVIEETRAQFEVVRRLINAASTERLICATDAGREGELIFRFIYEAAHCRKPVRRLWLSSMVPEAIRSALQSLRDWGDYDRLAAAARGRAQADWLVGMNLSRAYTLTHGETLSVGRVQTPTLAMVVAREKEIEAFTPEDFYEVTATFQPVRPEGSAPAHGPATYTGIWFRRQGPPEKLREAARSNRRLPADGIEAQRIADRVRRAGCGLIESIEEETKRLPPPLLHDLADLQRQANRLYGFTAQKTLETAQRLYETHKLLSYPRTDSRHLSTAVAATLPDVVRAVSGPYRDLLAAGTGQHPLSRRFVDDTKVTDHHAIIPTTSSAEAARLTEDEGRVYDLVCRRLLAAWHTDHVWAVTTLITTVDSQDPRGERIVDSFSTTGIATIEQGWKSIEPADRPRSPRVTQDQQPADLGSDLPSGLLAGQAADVQAIEAQKKQTRPPRRFTDATLLTAMESAGRGLDDKALSRAMQDCGIGTPATRAAIIELLLARGFIAREAKTLSATPKGIHLIDLVHPAVKTPAMTGEWEAKLRRIERGEGDLREFMHGIEEYVRQVVGIVFSTHTGTTPQSHPRPEPAHTPSAEPVVTPSTAPGPSAQPAATPSTASTPPAPSAARATPGAGPALADTLKRLFRFDGFRPYQEAVCSAVVAGEDVLLVMPTGAGKSLCYQLPGIVRGGTTLVVSPLIALMEDQVGKLQQLGLRADRIHSARDRVHFRAVCDEYLAGRLDFLFVAPERLGVPGFPDLLARRPPALVAVDEAHCISHWGHDFRPDYRMLGQRLPQLRPAPVIAMTATATPRVQADIAEQLRLSSPRRFIHGFRRENIAIEVVEVPKPERGEIVAALLADPARRPAILYAPTRRDSEALAHRLAGRIPAAAYHAGMPGAARDSAQTRFIAGEVDTVVATIAFGMGVDKPDVRTVVHLALPQTLEGYYQEIGRAGRDRKPSRAILMHSFADRKINEFFRERDYPDPRMLQLIYGQLGPKPEAREELRRRATVPDEIFDVALEKLWIHGGALLDSNDAVRRGEAQWAAGYEAQRALRKEQEEEMARFARSHGCRMLHLVRHFGDSTDPGHSCRLCDNCGQIAALPRPTRRPDEAEQQAMRAIVEALKKCGSASTGKLYRDLFEGKGLERSAYETLLSALTRAGVLAITREDFEKDGRQIEYQRVRLTREGWEAGAKRVEDVEVSGALAAAGPRGLRRRRAKRIREAPSRSEQPARQAQAEPHQRPVEARHPRPLQAEDRIRASEPQQELVEALRAWRLATSKRRRTPAFRILHDSTLYAIASAGPRTETELLEVRGVGPAFIRKYGAEVLKIVRGGA